jgi:hypothetical protein
LNVKVATTPALVAAMSSPEMASLKPPLMSPLVLSNKEALFPTVSTVSLFGLLYSSQVPTVTFVTVSTAGFQDTVEMVNPQTFEAPLM